jgi:hypothetical protein
MTSDFKPGKAYLIEGKNIEQVKSEIKEWFFKNGLELLDEEPYLLEGYKYSIFKYEVWIKIKLIENSKGILLTFDNRYTKKYLRFFLTILSKNFLEEMRKDLIRAISRKKEIKARLIFGLLNILATIYFFGITFYIVNFYRINKIESLSIKYFLICFLVYYVLINIIDILTLFIIKNISLNDKYYIEEHKGEIEID